MSGNTLVNSDKLISQLSDKASAKRMAAAKKLGRLGDKSAGAALYDSFLKERQDIRTYQSQAAMADALGLLRYAPAADLLLEIIQARPEHDMLGRASATAYCRLTRSSLSDAAPVLKLLSLNRFSISMGASLALGCDRMVPSDEDIHAVLQYSATYRYQNGFGDPR